MNKDELFFVGQKAFIRKGEEVLVIDEVNAGLDFPGGKIQQGETNSAESLKREVREETGLEIMVGPPFAVWWTNSRNYPGKRIFLIGYKCQYQSGEVKLEEDGFNNFQWVNKENYKELDNKNPYFKILENYFNS